jgi:hypothetical protein
MKKSANGSGSVERRGAEVLDGGGAGSRRRRREGGGAVKLPDLEALVDETYRRAGIDPKTPTTPRQLAVSLWRDRDAVQFMPSESLRRNRAVLCSLAGGRLRIYVRDNVTPQTFRFLVGHELAHAVYVFAGVRFRLAREEEIACDELANAFLARIGQSDRRRIRRFRGRLAGQRATTYEGLSRLVGFVPWAQEVVAA